MAIKRRLEAARERDTERQIREAWSSRNEAAAEIDFHPAVAADRRLRKDSGGNHADTLLKAAALPAKMHKDGKTVMGEEGIGSSGERLPMRGMPICYFNSSARLTYRPSLGTKTTALVADSLADIQNNRPVLLAGLMIASAGLVVNMGG